MMAMVVGIYMIVDFFERIDNFMEAKLPFSKALTFFFFKTPFIVAQLLPVCILLAVLVVFGLMTRHNEIIALKSSGVNIFYLVKPVLVMGIGFSIFLFFFSEVIVPIAMEKANQIWLREVRKETAVLSKGKNIWIKGDHSITHITYFNPQDNVIFGVTNYQFDGDFRLIRRLDAERAVYESDRWLLYDVMEQNLDSKDNSYKIKFKEHSNEAFDFFPENLNRVIKKSEEMSYKELLEYIKSIEKEGYDATIYRVDLYSKTAFPLVCIIMCMIGTGIAVRGRVKEGLPVSIAYGIGIAFLYWIFYSLCISLGHGEVLPPMIAAWTANFVFLCLGTLTLLYAD
jgi:lipopolysaccharide export system permease protein